MLCFRFVFLIFLFFGIFDGWVVNRFSERILKKWTVLAVPHVSYIHRKQYSQFWTQHHVKAMKFKHIHTHIYIYTQTTQRLERIHKHTCAMVCVYMQTHTQLLTHNHWGIEYVCPCVCLCVCVVRNNDRARGSLIHGKHIHNHTMAI